MKELTVAQIITPEPAFPKPRVMLVDMDDTTNRVLRSAGFNVTEGSFGKPRVVQPSDRFYPISNDWPNLYGLAEQEILIINNAKPEVISEEIPNPGDGVESFWQVGDNGDIDARPLAMRGIQESVDTILAYGGIAVVLLGSHYTREITKGSMRGRFNFRDSGSFECSNFDFSIHLQRVKYENANGKEIEFVDSGKDLARFLSRGADGARYHVRIAPNRDQVEHWSTLAKDKYGHTVAALLMREAPRSAILMLPQMPNFHVIAVDLIRDFCARSRPHLFPFHDKQAWLHSDRYELASITQKKARIATIRNEADVEIEKLHSEIEADRTANADWYVLLNGTGDELVNSVMNTLRRLGFEDVVDMDEQARQNGTEKNLREDVQIRDRDPILVVDIKGIVGAPADDESTQAQKHATMRSRELNRFVKPLTIINHQRNLPPHERSPEPYRPEIVQNAEDTGLGLMTTWDLFLLRRNQENLGWTSEQILPIFYRDGRIKTLPMHYEEIGVIVHVWKHAIGIVPSRTFSKSSRLSVQVDGLFHELPVNEIECDGTPSDVAPQGGNCGIACDDTSNFRVKMRVFLVN